MKNDPVAKQFVNLNLTGGVNKKQDAHQLSNGQLLTAENVIFGAVDGQVTKRFGCKAITPQGLAFQGGPFKSIGMRDNIEPLVLGANTLNRYNIEQNLATSLSTPTQGRLDVKQVVGSTGQTLLPWPPSDPSVATDGVSYTCLTWQEPSTTSALCYYGVQDLQSGTWIIPPTTLAPLANAIPSGYTMAAMYSPTVKYFNGNFYLFYVWVGQLNSSYAAFVFYNTLNVSDLNTLKPGTTSITISGSNTIAATSSPSNFGYDAHVANGRFIMCAGPSNDSPFNFDVTGGTVGTDGALLANYRGVYDTGTNIKGQRCAVRCDGPAANPYLIASARALTAFTPNFIRKNTTLNSYISDTAAAHRGPVDCMWLPDGTAVWAGTYLLQTMRAAFFRFNFTDIPTFTFYFSPINTLYMQLVSRLFMPQSNGKVYAWVGAAGPSSDSVYNSVYLCEADFNTLKTSTVCRTLYLQNAHITNNDMMVPCDVVKAAPAKYITFISSALEKTSVKDYHSFGALNRIQYDFAPARSTQLIALPQGGVLGAGSYPFYYDGVNVVEAGFSVTPTADAMSQTYVDSSFFTPKVVAASNGPKGGSSFVTASGSIEYYYVICLVRRDGYGNVYRSAPSPVVTVPCPNDQQTVVFPAYTYNGGGNVMIEFYRSTQNITGTYYFLGQVPNGQPFRDTYEDGSTSPSNNTSITKNRTVYTNANELPNDPPPAIHHATVSDTRVYMIPADARNTIWFSKTFAPGRTVEFSANNVLTTGNNSGLFTAIHVLDSYVIVFKADQVQYFYGNGPDNTGSGSFSSFQKISTDVGCIDPASIVTIPDGILFRSRRGIELLNRSLQVIYVGGPIEPLLKGIKAFASTVLVPRFRQVRFVPQEANQPVLVFDYGAGRWSTFSKMSAVNATVINGNYWWISQDGTKVYQETPDEYLDDGLPIAMTLETPEIPVGMGGVQGWGRAYRMALLGDFYSDHTLLVSFSYDHKKEYTDSVVFNSQSGLISGDAVYQFRCSRLPRQVMQTVRIRITDSGVVGQSCAISNIALEVGSKNGLAKLAPQKTV